LIISILIFSKKDQKDQKDQKGSKRSTRSKRIKKINDGIQAGSGSILCFSLQVRAALDGARTSSPLLELSSAGKDARAPLARNTKLSHYLQAS
jgi:hypothetical protein